MEKYNAMEEGFEEITLFTRPVLFTPVRIDRGTLPRGYHLYEMRYNADKPDYTVRLARNIRANHWGTIITRDEIKLPDCGFLDIGKAALNYEHVTCRSMKTFMRMYPPKTNPQKSHER